MTDQHVLNILCENMEIELDKTIPFSYIVFVNNKARYKEDVFTKKQVKNIFKKVCRLPK